MSYAEDLRQYRALLRALNDRFTKPIYHYTTAEGFRGIVASSEIWLTNARFVNDTTECEAFWDCAEDLAGDERLVNEDVREKLRYRLEDRPENVDYYVASFCRMGNSLSQYHAYGGICIGFDPRKMKKDRFHMYRCAYNARNISDWVCRKANLRQWDGNCLKDDSKRGAAHDLVFAASVKHKHEAYKDEREVRMVAVSHHTWKLGECTKAMVGGRASEILRFIHRDDPPIHSRDCPVNGPVPFVKFFLTPGDTKEDSQTHSKTETEAEMKRRNREEEDAMQRELLPIREVWIGPMAQQEETRLACEIMLREQGYGNVEVIASKIPYRGL